MSKIKDLQKKLTKRGIAVGGAVAVSIGLVIATGAIASSAAASKTAAESARSQDQSQLSSMQAQMQQSGDAEKRFVEISRRHANPDYSADSEAMKIWLRDAKERYRLSNSFKLSLALEKVSDKPEFTGINYDILVREPMRIELDAISDVHVLSFLDQFMREAPGILKLTHFEMTRKNDMDDDAYRQMLSGVSPEFVGAKIEFVWLGVQPKDAAASGQQPAVPGA